MTTQTEAPVTGSDALCERTACQGEPPHAGKEHIDPDSPRYDGPDIAIVALPSRLRHAARALLAAGGSPADVGVLVNEIHNLRDQIGAVRADADRRAHAEAQRALSCEVHGQEIAELQKQVNYFTNAAARNDEARVALLALPFEIQKLRDDAVVSGRDLKAAAQKVLAAHDRAWRGRGRRRADDEATPDPLCTAGLCEHGEHGGEL